MRKKKEKEMFYDVILDVVYHIQLEEENEARSCEFRWVTSSAEEQDRVHDEVVKQLPRIYSYDPEDGPLSVDGVTIYFNPRNTSVFRASVVKKRKPREIK